MNAVENQCSLNRGASRKQIPISNRFEDVRLALRVAPEQDMEAWRKIRIQPRVISEVAKSQMGQTHGARLAESRTSAEGNSRLPTFGYTHGGLCLAVHRSICLLELCLGATNFFHRRSADSARLTPLRERHSRIIVHTSGSAAGASAADPGTAGDLLPSGCDTCAVQLVVE